MAGMSTLPWLMPGIVISILLALLASQAFGRILATRPAIAWVILVGLGVVISATLTPLQDASGVVTSGNGACDLSRLGFAPIASLLQVDDTSLNILLFIPLGMGIGMLRGSGRKAILFAVALALPLSIEGIQLLVPFLERGCQSADVIDNVTGLLIGVGMGTGARFVGTRFRGA